MKRTDAAFLGDVLAAIVHPIYVRDEDQRIVFVNRALCKLLGRSESELLGRTTDEVFAEAEPGGWHEAEGTILGTGEMTQLAAELVDAEGRRRHVTVTKAPIIHASGQSTCVVSVLHDVTHLRAVTDELERTRENLQKSADARARELADAQAGLVRKERLAVLGQLAGGMAHQIRNPLGAIKNAAYVLERHVAKQGTDEAPWALSIIHDEVKRANQIITHLLDYARVRAPILRTVDVTALIDQVLIDRSPPPHIEVVRRLDDVPPLSIDADQVHGALANLVDNALDAMGQTESQATQRLVVESRVEGGEVVLALEDSGPGVAPEIEGHLFEPLFTTKPLGLGLGLVTARTLIAEQGGSLELVKPHGAGARFEVRLPLHRDEE